MSLHKLGYSYTSEYLKLKEYQALKEKLESLEKINQITHSKLKEDFENHEEKLKEEFLDSKLIKDIYSQFSSNTMKN